MKKLKFLFSVSPFNKWFNNTPFGTAIIATMAKNAGFDVEVLCSEFDSDESSELHKYNNQLVDAVRNKKIDVVCLASLSDNYPEIKHQISLLHKEGCSVILGGYIVDASQDVVPQNIGADYCIYGEGEYTFLELAHALENDLPLDSINGLIWKKGGMFTKNPPRPYVDDLDKLPYIEGELCHYELGLNSYHTLPVLMSRSCPYQCTFCYHIENAPYRKKSLDYFFGELDHYLGLYGDIVQDLFIVDDLLGVERDRLYEFCERIKRYKLGFVAQMRVDCVDDEVLTWLKEAGCSLIVYGLESASNKVLKSMKKGITIEKALEAFELTRKHKILIRASIIIGDVEDDLEILRENEEFFLKYWYKYGVNIDLIIAFPGTQLYKYAIKNGIIEDEIKFLEMKCPYVNISKLPDEVYGLLKPKYEKYGRFKTALRDSLTQKPYELIIHKNGKFDCAEYCPNCYSRLENRAVDYRLTYGYTLKLCPYCENRLSASSFFLLAPGVTSNIKTANKYEKVFGKIKEKKVVVWGINDSIRRIIVLSDILRNNLVAVVDLNYQSMPYENYCGFHVAHPSSLKDIEFECIVACITERRRELVDQLEQWGKEAEIISL